MERWMIVYVLPLEVWMDIFVFPWISRREFGQLVAKIGNFKFAEHAQFYLHEWGKRSLGDVNFKEDGLYKLVNRNPFRVRLPQTPLPENIKSIEAIAIDHFDANTLHFLTKITPLLTDLKIDLCYLSPERLENLRTILNNLAPMLDGIQIQSLFCSQCAFPAVKEQLFRENGKWAKIKWLEICIDSTVEQREMFTFIMNWLSQPDIDGPRLLEFRTENDYFKEIFTDIREHFLVATTSRTFAVTWKHFFWQEKQVAEFHLENNIGEEMHGKWAKIFGQDFFQVTRHRAGWNTEEAQKWIKAMTKGRDDRKISIYNPTIGSVNIAPQMALLRVDEGQDNQPKPCSSKDV